MAGVSWYESAAYAVFAGKTLPTVYHWNRAAQTEASLATRALYVVTLPARSVIGAFPAVAGHRQVAV